MPPRSSQQEQDAVTWGTGKLKLGQLGLDLRKTSEPGALAKLLNARFRDEATLERRNGYRGIRLRDAGGYPTPLDANDNPVSVPMTPTGWVYGHGQQLLSSSLTRENEHLPIPGQARGVFTDNGNHVVWTGDRLLIVREDGYAALGQSAHWGQDNDADELKRGVPAYLPVVRESTPVDTISGAAVETCLTELYRFVVGTDSNGVVYAWITHRDTGVMISKTDLSSDTLDTDPCDVRVFQSADFVVVTWRDATSNRLYYTYYTGSVWHATLEIGSGCDAYDVALVPSGFHVLWRVGSELHVGRFSGKMTQDTPYVFNTTIGPFTESGANVLTPNGPVALDVAPDNSLVVVFEASGTVTSGLFSVTLSSSLTAGIVELLKDLTTWDAGLTVRFRALSRSIATETRLFQYDVYAGRNGSIGTPAVYFFERNSAAITVVRYNAQVASKAFRVGDRTFCWLRATNSSTLFLIAGGNTVIVSGVADREEATERELKGTSRAISQVVQDPRDEYTFTFARPFITGQDYARGGNTRIGDIDFLPALSAVQYGKSIYLAGSNVRNWDGKELGDAGFHDYPAFGTHSTNAVGGLMGNTKEYRFRVYPVRYNARGERFQGAALTYTLTTGGGADTYSATLNIKTISMTNHDDVVLEVYRTEGGGTTYYLDGTIDNNREDSYVTYESTQADTTLRTKPADPHETGVGGIDELEEFGPTGCEFLAVAADRLWGAGGQVPRGRVEFSKLKETVEGAGFDALAGWQEVDCQGGDITSIAGYADSALVIFERERIYVLFGDGPNNYGDGAFSTPQLTLSDGAISNAGTCVTQEGIFFWGVDGPRWLTPGFKVQPICDPVRPLTKSLTPSCVQVDYARREVVWFTEEGTAVLMNYAGPPRWAQWSGLKIAGCSPAALVTTTGVLLIEDEDANGDFGVPFEFAGATGELDAEQLLEGRTMIREVGIVGKYLGAHRLRLRVYYNGSELWTDQWVWSPTTNTWLLSIDDVADLTPAQVDALNAKDQSGKYATHKRTSRHECMSFRVEWSDISAHRPTYMLHQLVFELGARGGLARIPAGTFSRS